jgi:hypothetical protein
MDNHNRERMNHLSRLMLKDKASVEDWLEFKELYVRFDNHKREQIDSKIDQIVKDKSDNKS